MLVSSLALGSVRMRMSHKNEAERDIGVLSASFSGLCIDIDNKNHSNMPV